VIVVAKAPGHTYAKIEYAYDKFRTLNSIHPTDLSETYVYPFTPVQLCRQKKIVSQKLIELTILHYRVRQ